MTSISPTRLQRTFSSARIVRTRSGPASVPWQLYLLASYLAGIIVIGKGPTYIGYPPVFWGEVVLLLALTWTFCDQGSFALWRMKPRALSSAVALFMLVGAGMTAAYLQQWGLDCARDSAIWYYAGFYFIGLGVASHEHLAGKFVKLLMVFWTLALCWGVVEVVSSGALSRLGPVIPWRGLSLTSNSFSELRQNMSFGALAVLITGFWRHSKLRPFLSLIAVAGLVMAGTSKARGPKVALAGALITVLLLATGSAGSTRMARRLVAVIAGGLLCIPLALVLLDVDLAKVTQVDRFVQADPENPSGTAYWRKLWWKRINEQVMARNPLFGLGFGENLSTYNPLIVGDSSNEWPVRSPHNFNMTVYARMGTVGAALWAIVLALGPGALFLRLWRGSGPAGPYHEQRKEELTFWLMVVVASWINSSFGVLMEGPVLAIPFWFILGFASRRALEPSPHAIVTPRRTW